LEIINKIKNTCPVRSFRRDGVKINKYKYMKIQTKQKINILNFLTGMKNITCPVVNYEKTIVRSLCGNLKQNNIKSENVSGFRNFTTGIKTLIIVIVGLLAISQSAFASNIILSASPLSATNTIGTNFNVTIQVDPMGNNFDVVKGTLIFDNLSCQNITPVNGLLSMVVPTCATPNFVIGIPKGTSLLQNIFSVSVRGNGAGQAKISFSGVKVIRAGVDVTFSSLVSTYNILAVVPVEISTTTPPADIVLPPVEVPVENIGTEIAPDTGLQVPSDVGEFNNTENNEVTVSTTTSSSSAIIPVEKDNGLVATAILGFSNIPNKAMAAIILIAITAIAGLMYYTRRNDKNTPDKPNPTESF
jgi:hypothetical protein